MEKRHFWLNFFYYAHTWHNLIQVNWDVCHHVSCVGAKIDEDRKSLVLLNEGEVLKFGFSGNFFHFWDFKKINQI